MKILVIDDDAALLSLSAIHIKRLGHEAHLATTGEAGEAMAREVQPDLILLDVWMPLQDGLVTLIRLRKWYTGPIIMVTALKGVDNRHNAFVLGATDYWEKPFSGAMLAKALDALREQ